MFWLGFVVLVLVMGYASIRRAQRAGTWSWSKFLITLGFLAIVCVIVTVPAILINLASPFFWPVYGAGWAVALVLIVWFAIRARRWKLPNSQPPVAADRNQPPSR
jgi:hypothetical protein